MKVKDTGMGSENAVPHRKKMEIVILYYRAKTIAEIARVYRLKDATVERIIDQHLRGKKKPSDKEQWQPRKDIKAVDYSNHDELSRHYEGAEYEDNRAPKLRGKDWPIR